MVGRTPENMTLRTDGICLRSSTVAVRTGPATRRLDLSVERIRGSVREFLAASGAYGSYPGLAFDVDVDPATSTVTVHVTAPLDLPLTVPGSPGVAQIGATGSAVVVAEQ